MILWQKKSIPKLILLVSQTSVWYVQTGSQGRNSTNFFICEWGRWSIVWAGDLKK